MSTEVVIVDYGAGNLRSVANIFDMAGVDAEPSADPDVVRKADRLVLPGVGAAGYALDGLQSRGLDAALHEAVRERGAPMLGICVGMQVLGEMVSEYGERPALGWTSGKVVPLSTQSDPAETVPNMGWSAVALGDATPDWMRQPLKRDVYFCHSFGMVGAPEDQVAASGQSHGGFVAAIVFDTVAAVQFHPEKSQVAGLELIEGFVDWSP